MPTLIERPKMTRSMYQALKRHIMREREKKKQEQEQDAEMERLRKERELRKKKEAEDSLTLEQTKEQITTLEKRLDVLKQEKHDLFSQLKKVLHEDETRKRAKEQSEMLHMQPQYPQGMAVQGHHPLFMQASPMGGRPTMYKNLHQQSHSVLANMKRPRSPSPPSQPSSMYQPFTKYPASSYATPVKQEPQFNHAQSRTQNPTVSYSSQSGPNYQPSQQGPVHANSQSPAGKYPAVSQSAFTSYPNHYAHQQKITEHYPQGYPVQRLQQPGARLSTAAYLSQQHTGSKMPLQQQLEHANQKSGFNEDKFKLQPQIRGLSPLPPHQQSMVPPQMAGSQPHAPGQPGQGLPTPPAPQKGSIMTGYPVRTQPAPTSSSYQPSTAAQAGYQMPQQSAGQRPSYPQQPGRYY